MNKDSDAAPAPSSTGPDQRRARRQRALKAARVILSDTTTLDCMIRDVNEGGARLEFAAATSLPPEFRLLVVAVNTIRPARLLWQRGLAAGIAFAGPEVPAPARKS